MSSIFSKVFPFFQGKKQQRVFVVSFPRSGHHAMVGFLNKVSDFASNYCEFYNCTRHNGEAIECSKANLNWRLKQSSCGAGNKIVKNHDFNLSLSYDTNNKFIIQFRHPFYSILSWYELDKKDGKSVEPWPDFFDKKLKFWCQFVNKWVVKYGEKSNVLIVPYETLSDKKVIENIAQFSGVNLYDMNKLGVNYFKNKRELNDPDGFYKKQEEAIIPLLNQAKIPLLFH